jgi:glycosyltransferase involved in cell wall biosynthesis
MASPLTISVIIPTYNGAHKILNVLRALENQSRMPEEIIVVIDGSTDGTADLIRSHHFDLPSLRIVEQANGGRAQVRNRGAQEAKSELLVFFDDDMIPDNDCVRMHFEHHQKHMVPGILTGGLKEPIRDEFSGFKSWLNDKWTGPLLDLGDAPMSDDNFYITAGNFSILASLFSQMHGFDQRLTDSEDFDLATRAMKKGVSLYFGLNAWAYHNESMNCRQYIRRIRQYTISHNHLSATKPDLYKEGNRYKSTAPTGLKGVVFRLFCTNMWISSIDRNFWTWLPKSARYKLYDVIVTANGSFFPEKVAL